MRKNICTSNNGFSFVEALVAGMISLLVFTILFTIFQMNMDQVSHGATNMKVKIQYQTVIDQIAANVRKASLINTINAFPTFNISPVSGDTLYLFDINGNSVGAYKRSGTADFKEKKGSTWYFFRVGSNGNEVKVTSVNPIFTVSNGMKTVTLNLSVFVVSKNVTDTVFSKKETFSCRN